MFLSGIWCPQRRLWVYSNFLGMYAAGLWYNKSNNKVGFAYFSQETFLTICFAFLPLHGPPQLYLFQTNLHLVDEFRAARHNELDRGLLEVRCVVKMGQDEAIQTGVHSQSLTKFLLHTQGSELLSFKAKQISF